jgi:hypothetical protein
MFTKRRSNGEDEPQLVGAQRPVLVGESDTTVELWVARQALLEPADLA